MAPRGKTGDAIMAEASATPSIQEEAEATYEEMRQKNIDENKAMLQKLLSELKGMPGIPMFGKKQVKRTPKKEKQSQVTPSDIERRRNPTRSARSTPRRTVKTRSMRLRRKQRKEKEQELEVDVGEGGEEEGDVFSREPGQKLKIKFGLFGKRKAKSSDGNSDEDHSTDSDSDFEVYEDQELSSPKKRRKVTKVRHEPTPGRPVDDISQEEMDMVADSVRDKEYDSTASGSTCHQCRQKTNDMKTVCRSGLCYGVRGQFCGPCLRNRYGEDARAALMDPNWSCPPCRGVCNCSFCRAKSGRRATGILIHLAKSSGYSNVMEYLQSFKLESK